MLSAGLIAISWGSTPARAAIACTDKNNYLEALLAPSGPVNCVECHGAGLVVPASYDELQKSLGDLALPPSCVIESIESTPEHAYRYGQCLKTDKKGNAVFASTRVPKPCASDRYELTAYTSYIETMRCLGIDPRELFPVINEESSFQINIGSWTGAWGVGQLTPIAVDSVNQMKALSGYSDKSECAPVKDLLAAPMTPKNMCDWVMPPQSPAKNFLYAGAAYLIFKKIAERTVAGSTLFRKTPASERAKIVIELTRLMYNGGDGGIRQALGVFAEENVGTRFTAAAFKKAFRKYLAENYGDGIAYYARHADRLAAKRKEVSTYTAAIEGKLARVEKKLGMSCSD